jgi:DNA-binding LacI/PurR family transcriptional regulator
MEGCHQYPNACGIEGSVIHLPTQSWRIKNEIVRLLQRQPRPTALLVDNPYMYLTVFSIITQMGLQVPGDVSMISRQAETFLTHLQPRPACYIQNHLKFANRLARITMRSLHGEFSGDQVVRLMPQFFSGESIAPPASLSGS